MEITGKLENWHVACPVRGVYILCGRVFGDTKGRFSDGELIHTSQLHCNYKELKEGGVARTRYSNYLLGEEAT